MPAFRDLTGKRFHRLVACSFTSQHIGAQQRVVWLCRCDCGNDVSVFASNLTQGYTLSCGCWRHEFPRANKTHGQTRTQLYTVWASMRSRCENSTVRSYMNYGGRGITVCSEWRQSFAAFARDMGPRPSPKHTIERIDNFGPYSPSNCRWATRVEQGANKRNNRLLTWRGQRMTMSQWSRSTGITVSLLHDRLMKRGWSTHNALSTPPRPIRLQKHPCD